MGELREKKRKREFRAEGRASGKRRDAALAADAVSSGRCASARCPRSAPISNFLQIIAVGSREREREGESGAGRPGGEPAARRCDLVPISQHRVFATRNAYNSAVIIPQRLRCPPTTMSWPTRNGIRSVARRGDEGESEMANAINQIGLGSVIERNRLRGALVERRPGKFNKH